jgi:hypothetical protein
LTGCQVCVLLGEVLQQTQYQFPFASKCLHKTWKLQEVWRGYRICRDTLFKCATEFPILVILCLL